MGTLEIIGLFDIVLCPLMHLFINIIMAKTVHMIVRIRKTATTEKRNTFRCLKNDFILLLS